MSEAAATRVLVVEDDAQMAAGIVRGLRGAGFEVELATRGDDAARLALGDPAPHVIVLDLLLPEQSGFAVLEQIHGRCAAPVIVLTARTELHDRLKSFDLGAADFVAKPFFLEELVARIRSRLGRREAPRRVVEWADAVVDLDARSARTAGGDVGLTRHELDILAYLVERPGRAVSRAQLAERAALPFSDRDARTVDTHVARVRKKLGPAAAGAIVTVWGIGYRFDPPPSRSSGGRP